MTRYQFHCTYYGWVNIRAEEFSTRRNGKAVRLVRWAAADGSSISTFARPFASLEAAEAAISRVPALFRVVY